MCIRDRYEYLPGFIHSKTCVVDDQFGMVGTINLDYRSLYLHFECGVWLYQSRSVETIRDDFLATQAMSQQVQLAEIQQLSWGKMCIRDRSAPGRTAASGTFGRNRREGAEKIMSFSSETKGELCRERMSHLECAQAEAYGVLLFCNVFTPWEAVSYTHLYDKYKKSR